MTFKIRIKRLALWFQQMSMLGVLFFLFNQPLSFSQPTHVMENILHYQDKGAAKRIEDWKSLLRSKKARSVNSLLKQVNDFFNQLEYIPESSLQGSADVWLTPYEFLAEGGGDCEDFAIAKYFTLVAMGIKSTQLRITYVAISPDNSPHMVLAYYSDPNADPLILDNLTQTILPASRRDDLVPVYGFNVEEVWLNERVNKARPYGKPSDLSKWRALIERIQLEERNTK